MTSGEFRCPSTLVECCVFLVLLNSSVTQACQYLQQIRNKIDVKGIILIGHYNSKYLGNITAVPFEAVLSSGWLDDAVPTCGIDKKRGYGD